MRNGNEKTSSTTTKHFTGREIGTIHMYIPTQTFIEFVEPLSLRICHNPTPEMDSPYCRNGEWYIGKADSIYGRKECLKRTREDNWYGQNETEEDNVQRERL